MSGVATAIAGAAVVGAYASNKASDKASAATKNAANTASQDVRRSVDEARADINRLFPQAQQSAQQGFQNAVDVFGQTMPQQANQFQGGNVAAQNQLLAGLPQMQNAILGGPVDYSQFQAYQAPPLDFGFTNQQIGGQGGISGGLAAGGPISPLTGLPVPSQASVLEPIDPAEPTGQNTMTPTNPAWQFQNLFGGGQ